MPAAATFGGYCSQRLRISGVGHNSNPRFRPPRLGPWPYTVSVANSFRCSFVWALWPDHQPRSAVVATPLADSKPSYHDSSNAPATPRSVYVIVYTAARSLRLAPRFWDGAVAPCDRDLRNKDTAACCRALWGLLRRMVIVEMWRALLGPASRATALYN